MTIKNITPTLDEAREAFTEEPGDRKCLTVYLADLLQYWQDGMIADTTFIAEMNAIVDMLDEIDPVFVTHDDLQMEARWDPSA